MIKQFRERNNLRLFLFGIDVKLFDMALAKLKEKLRKFTRSGNILRLTANQPKDTNIWTAKFF